MSRQEHKGLRGKSTVARIRAIVAFNDSFRDRSGISYNRLFDCLHGRLEKRLSLAVAVSPSSRFSIPVFA